MDRGGARDDFAGGGGRALLLSARSSRRSRRRRIGAIIAGNSFPSAAVVVAAYSIFSAAAVVPPSSAFVASPQTGAAANMRAAAIVAKSAKTRGASGGAARFGYEGRRDVLTVAPGGAHPRHPSTAARSFLTSSSSSALLSARSGRSRAAGGGWNAAAAADDSAGLIRGTGAAATAPWGGTVSVDVRIRPPRRRSALFSTAPLEVWGNETVVDASAATAEVTTPKLYNGVDAVLFSEAATPNSSTNGAVTEEGQKQSSRDVKPDPLPPAFEGAVVVGPSDVANIVRPMTAHDYLIGRGKVITDFPGNVLFRSVAEDRCVEYVESDRNGKGGVIADLLRSIDGTGGAFLRKLDKKTEGGDGANGGRWVALDEKEARKKIAEALRAAGKRRGVTATKGGAKVTADSKPSFEASAVEEAVNGAKVDAVAETDTAAPSEQNQKNPEPPLAVDAEVVAPDNVDVIDLLVPDDRPPIVPYGVHARRSPEPLLAPPADDPIYDGLMSRPIANADGVISGNWEPSSPVRWADIFGSRTASDAARLERLVRLRPGDEGYFDPTEVDAAIPDVTIVRTVEDARIVMERLMAPENRGVVHACDTEVMDIDLKKVGPVGNGYVTCISVYSGEDFDYGLGLEPGGALWVDNLDDAAGVLQEFKPFFEAEDVKMVWHNYGFDRHVLWNEGIDCRGLGGDTMHLARLQDTSRSRTGGPNGGEGYGLEALTASLLGRRKKPMKELFGIPRLRKDGTEGSIVDIPPVEKMQRDPRHRRGWIMYSAYDAEGTWRIHEKLKALLEGMKWVKGRNLYEYYEMYMAEFAEVLTDMERRGISVDAKDYLAGVEVQARKDREYHKRAFQEWAQKQIGPDALALNPASSTQLQTLLFGGAANEKTRVQTEEVRVFRVPREEISDEAMEAYRERDRRRREQADPAEEPTEDHFDKMNAAELKLICKDVGLKMSGKKVELQQRLREYYLANEQAAGAGAEAVAYAPVPEDEYASMSEMDLRDVCKTRALKDEGSRKVLIERLRSDSEFAAGVLYEHSPDGEDGYKMIANILKAAVRQDGNEALKQIVADQEAKAGMEPKYVDVTVNSLGMKPEKFTAGGAPSVTADVLRKLAGDPFADPPQYGTAYEFFYEGERGHDACVALFSLTAIGSIDTMIANFLTSLQFLADEQSRVHGSVNLNTETGRLSSRRPNLQNQPALEKDKYKIRKAFQASPGNNLIVADYGQLELRLLASMTNCESMIEAFEAGGDFHSRTALGMFDYIQEKVEAGECLLEWDYSKGEPDKPMLKDEFASERRKAKTLNFSIAYGKTPHGLSMDWGVSREEAQAMLDKWYDSRPEVRDWQVNTKKLARKEGYTRTLMGRYRQLPDAMGRDRKLIGHAERASINTPIQGGAADVVMMAMLKINKSEKLKRLGWILLMQIHDEVILEGPEETAEEAFTEVLECMESPWVFGLDKTAVPLLVDGTCKHKNWYDAK